MVICPIKNEAWNNFVKQAGSELEAYKQWITNGYEIPGNSAIKYETITESEVKSRLSKILPSNVSIDVVDKIIKFQKDNDKVWGYYSNKAITLGINAAKGTEYHEAFHAIFDMFTTLEEKERFLSIGLKKLTKELNSNGISFKQHVDNFLENHPYKSLSREKAESLVIEEYIADEFTNYMNSIEKPKTLFQELFEKIINLIKTILGNRNELELLFNKIQRGDYVNKSNTENYSETGEDLDFNYKFKLIGKRPVVISGTGEIVKQAFSPDESKMIIRNISATVTKLQQLKGNSKVSTEDIINMAIKLWSDRYNPNSTINAGLSEDNLKKLKESDYSYVFTDPFEIENIKQEVSNYIDSFSVDLDLFNLLSMDDVDEAEIGEKMLEFDRNAQEIGGLDKLPLFLKQYIATTTYEVTDVFGNSILGYVENINEDGTITNVPINIYTVIDPHRVYYGLLRSLANTYGEVDMLRKLIAFKKDNIDSAHLIDRLLKDVNINLEALNDLDNPRIVIDESNPKLQAYKTNVLLKVLKGFNKWSKDNLSILLDKGLQKAVTFTSNVKNADKLQFEQWQNTFANKRIDNNLNLGYQLNTLASSIFKSTEYLDKEFLEDSVEKIKKSLALIGINLHRNFIEYSILNSRYQAHMDEVAKGLRNLTDFSNSYLDADQFRFVHTLQRPEEYLLTGTTLSILGNLISTNQNPFLKSLVQTANDDDTVSYVEDENTGASGRLLKIAKGNSYFDESVFESSYQNEENKTIYGHQAGTFNLRDVKKLNNDTYLNRLFNTGIRDLNNTVNGINIDSIDSHFITNNYLNNPYFRKIAKTIETEGLGGIRETVLKGVNEDVSDKSKEKIGVVFGNMSNREFVISLMNVFATRADKHTMDDGEVFYTTPIIIGILESSKTSDLVRLPIVKNILDAYGNLTDEINSVIINEIKKEYDRIYSTARLMWDENTNSYKPNALEIVKKEHGFIAEGYHSFKQKDGSVVKHARAMEFTDNISPLLGKDLANKLQNFALNNYTFEDVLKEGFKDTLGERITEYMDYVTDGLVDYLVNQGIVKDQNNTYTSELLDASFFSGNEEVGFDAYFKDNLKRMIVGNFINTTSFQHILHGDFALNFKNDGGRDPVKRAKGDNGAHDNIKTSLLAPALGITEDFSYSNVAIIQDAVNENNTKIADAQMWHTVKAHRYAMFGLGRLTPELAEMLDMIEQGYDIPADKLFDKKGKARQGDFFLNSTKFVYKDSKRYLKMSAVPLTKHETSLLKPEALKRLSQLNNLLKDNEDKESIKGIKEEIKAIRLNNDNWMARPGYELKHNKRVAMESKNIHWVVPESGSKTLNINVLKQEPNGSYDFNKLEAQKLDNEYMGLQSETPTNKMKITAPTQMLQIIDSEQDDDVDITYDGKEIKIGTLRNMYQDWVSQRTVNSYNSAKNEIFDLDSFKNEIKTSRTNGEITPRLALFKDRAVENLKASAADKQLIEFFENEKNFNLNMPITREKFAQLFLSNFSKGVLSQKVPGHALALYSGWGQGVIKKAKVKNGKVISWEVIRRDSPEYLQLAYSGNKIQEKNVNVGDTNIKDGEIFIDRLKHNVPEINARGVTTGWYSEMIMPPHYKELAKSKELPKSIQKMFGVRIPSQDKHSAAAFKLVDYYPAYYGSIGIFANEIIELSGADFDIDKEYIEIPDVYFDKNGQARQYGYLQKPYEQYVEYKKYQLENNKPLKSIVKDLKNKSSEWQLYKTSDDDDIIGQIQYDYNNINENDIIAQYKETVKEEKRRLENEILKEAFKRLGLPYTFEEFKNSKGQELNNGYLNNKILKAKIKLLNNEGTLRSYKDETPIATTPATQDKLANIMHNESLKEDGKSVFGASEVFPTHSFLAQAQAHKNNTTGKQNIGIDVNSTMIYTVLNKGKVKLDYAYSSALLFDGAFLNTFEHQRTIDIPSGKYINERIMDLLSTLTSAATDEAKDQNNAKYELDPTSLRAVTTMVSMGCNLDTAVLLVNQPAIVEYNKLVKTERNAVKSSDEEEPLQKDAKISRALSIVASRVYDDVTKEEKEFLEVLYNADPRYKKNLERNKVLSYFRETKTKFTKDYVATQAIALYDTLYDYVTSKTVDNNTSFNDLAEDLKASKRNYNYGKDYVDNQSKYLDQYLLLLSIADEVKLFGTLITLTKGLGTNFDSFDNVMNSISDLTELIRNPDKGYIDKSSIYNVLFNPESDLYHKITGTNIEIVSEIRSLARSLFIERTNQFEKSKNFLFSNLDFSFKYNKDLKNKINNNYLSHIQILAYKNLLTKLGHIDKVNSINMDLVLDRPDSETIVDKYNKMTTNLKNIYVEKYLKLGLSYEKAIEKAKEDYFKNPFINMIETVPVITKNHQGKYVENKSANGVNKLLFKSRAKLDQTQISNIADSVVELLGYESTKPFVYDMVNYLIVKDGLQYTDRNIYKILPTELFKIFSASVDILQQLITANNTNDFKVVLAIVKLYKESGMFDEFFTDKNSIIQAFKDDNFYLLKDLLYKEILGTTAFEAEQSFLNNMIRDNEVNPYTVELLISDDEDSEGTVVITEQNGKTSLTINVDNAGDSFNLIFNRFNRINKEKVVFFPKRILCNNTYWVLVTNFTDVKSFSNKALYVLDNHVSNMPGVNFGNTLPSVSDQVQINNIIQKIHKLNGTKPENKSVVKKEEETQVITTLSKEQIMGKLNQTKATDEINEPLGLWTREQKVSILNELQAIPTKQEFIDKMNQIKASTSPENYNPLREYVLNNKMLESYNLPKGSNPNVLNRSGVMGTGVGGNEIIFEEDQNTGYRERTVKNASADATIALAYDFTSAGEKLTHKTVEQQGKKYIGVVIPSSSKASSDLQPSKEQVDRIVNELNSVNATSLNIAGNGIYTMKPAGYSQEQVDLMTYNLLKAVLESPNLKNKITSIRTGGQTGFDEAGAKAGFKLGIPTTILAPKGWKFRDISGKDISDEKQFKARFENKSSSENQTISEGNNSTNKEVIPLKEEFSRNSVALDKDYIYLFTDNAGRTSGSFQIEPTSWYQGYYGKGKVLNYPGTTQAVIRGLPNAMPITTMIDDKRTQWSDDQFDAYKTIIDEEVGNIKKAMSSGRFKGVKFSANAPFGFGKYSKIKENAPKIYEYLNSKLLEIGINNYGNKPTAVVNNKEKSVPTDVMIKLNSVIDNKNFIKLSDDEKTYINTKTGQHYQRVTSYISDDEPSQHPIKRGETMDAYLKRLHTLNLSTSQLSKEVLLASSQIIGTKVDTLVRDFFDDNLKPLASYGLANEFEVSNFINQLQIVKTKLDARGETVLSNDIVLYNDEIGVAGTVDLLTYDKDGNIRIYDMKSMRGDNMTEKYNNDNAFIYDSKKYGKSKREKHTDQLSLYRILLYNTHGLKAKQLAIMPIKLNYTAGDINTTSLELLKGIPIEPKVQVEKAILKGSVDRKTEELYKEHLCTDFLFLNFGPEKNAEVYKNSDILARAKKLYSTKKVNEALTSKSVVYFQLEKGIADPKVLKTKIEEIGQVIAWEQAFVVMSKDLGNFGEKEISEYLLSNNYTVQDVLDTNGNPTNVVYYNGASGTYYENNIADDLFSMSDQFEEPVVEELNIPKPSFISQEKWDSLPNEVKIKINEC